MTHRVEFQRRMWGIQLYEELSNW